MKVTVEKNYNPEIPNKFAATTTHGREVKAKPSYWFKCEHSPIRMFRYFITLTGLKTFVSVHLVRHGKFAEHAVMTNRDDLRPDSSEEITRESPVNHSIETNAQELISISRRRLCYKSHKETVAVWKHVCAEIKRVEPQLYPYLVPECVYRQTCPEHMQCKPGIKKVMKAYIDYPLYLESTRKWLLEDDYMRN